MNRGEWEGAGVTDTPIGERVATLEEQAKGTADDIERHNEEIRSLRDSRHAHGNTIQKLVFSVDAVEREQTDMSEQVVPAIRKTLEQQAVEISGINKKLMSTGIDFGWVMRILTFVLSGVITPLALLWMGYLISQK